jgi:hypothetical protein
MLSWLTRAQHLLLARAREDANVLLPAQGRKEGGVGKAGQTKRGVVKAVCCTRGCRQQSGLAPASKRLSRALLLLLLLHLLKQPAASQTAQLSSTTTGHHLTQGCPQAAASQAWQGVAEPQQALNLLLLLLLLLTGLLLQDL